MPDHLLRLKEITDLLLAEPVHYGSVREAAHSLKALFQEVTAFEESSVSLEHIETDYGRAVCTVSAAFCIIDFMRTRVFMQGTCAAISAKLRENPGKPVTVLYAGTGPFATLLTPLTTKFSPAQLKMVLLDLNPVSLEYLRKIISAFHMDDYVLDIMLADASTCQIETANHPDIILTETMMPGLNREPIVNIFANLAAQCPGAVMIPGLVRVEAALLGNSSTSLPRVYPLQTLMELSAAMAVNIHKQDPGQDIFHKGIEVAIPAFPDPVFSRFALLTYIKVFSGHELGLNECSLTIPFIFKNAGLIKALPPLMRFTYERSAFPGFKFSRS